MKEICSLDELYDNPACKLGDIGALTDGKITDFKLGPEFYNVGFNSFQDYNTWQGLGNPIVRTISSNGLFFILDFKIDKNPSYQVHFQVFLNEPILGEASNVVLGNIGIMQMFPWQYEKLPNRAPCSYNKDFLHDRVERIYKALISNGVIK